MGDNDERMESQSEATQEATPGGAQQRPSPPEGPPEYHRSRVRARTASTESVQQVRQPGGYAGLTKPVRDAVGRMRSRYEGLPPWGKLLVALGVIALAALLPSALPYITGQSQYWTNVLTKAGIAVLLALGLNVVVGFAGLLDLGYVAFFAVGAYSFAILSGAARYSVAVQAASGDPERLRAALLLRPTWHMYMWLFFFAALIIALIAGVILGAPTLRLRGDYLAIVTLGFGEIVRITANNLGSIDNGPQGVVNIPHPALPGYDFGLANPPYYYMLVFFIVAWVFLLRRLDNSRIGRAWVAVREDELAAAAMGVATIRIKLLAFAIGAAVASLGGVVYASQISFINPQTFTLFNPAFGSVIILAMVVLGGMGSLAGPMLGAGLIIFLPEYFRSVQDARFLVFGLAMVVIMVLRPQGLIPSRRRAAELRGGETRETSVFEARQHGAA